jgi:hypothetical protein
VSAFILVKSILPWLPHDTLKALTSTPYSPFQDYPSRSHKSDISKGPEIMHMRKGSGDPGNWVGTPSFAGATTCELLIVVTMWKHRPVMADFPISQKSRFLKKCSINTYWRHTVYWRRFSVYKTDENSTLMVLICSCKNTRKII